MDEHSQCPWEALLRPTAVRRTVRARCHRRVGGRRIGHQGLARKYDQLGTRAAASQLPPHELHEPPTRGGRTCGTRTRRGAR
eukprot:490029-Prymnesium_polylepis.1